MKILVCCKQVPASVAGTDPITHSVIREQVPLMMNPSDQNALEAALSLKDSVGASVSVLSMGKKEAAEMLRHAAALGADQLYLLTDPAFSGSDTLITAFILSKAVEYLGGYSLILCGAKTSDGETGQVGSQLAAFLGMEAITNCFHIQWQGAFIRCARRLEESSQTLHIPLPSLFTVTEHANHPRLATISGLRKAQSAEVCILSAADLGLNPEMCGFRGSPTKVISATRYQEHIRRPIYPGLAKGAAMASAMIFHCSNGLGAL